MKKRTKTATKGASSAEVERVAKMLHDEANVFQQRLGMPTVSFDRLLLSSRQCYRHMARKVIEDRARGTKGNG